MHFTMYGYATDVNYISLFQYDQGVARLQPEQSLNYEEFTFSDPPVPELSLPAPMITDDDQTDFPPVLELSATPTPMETDNPLESTRNIPSTDLNFTVNTSFDLTIQRPIEQQAVQLEE